MAGVYMIKNLVNDKVYIGKTIREFDVRWAEHIKELNNGIHHNSYLQRAWKKYGEDNFTFSILAECDDADTLNELEIKLIYDYNATNSQTGYNLTHGGEGGEMNEVAKVKHRTSLKQAWQNPNSVYNTEAYKAKLSASQKTTWKDPNSVYNSEEYRAKQSASQKTIWADQNSALNSEEYRAKQSASQRVHHSKLTTSETELLADGIFSITQATATQRLGRNGTTFWTDTIIKVTAIGIPILIKIASCIRAKKVKILEGSDLLFSADTIKSISEWLANYYIEEPDLSTAIGKLIIGARYTALEQLAV